MPTNETQQYLFAYGTLQPGANLNFFEENDLARYLEPVGAAYIAGELHHIENTKTKEEYPALIERSDDGQVVYGTLFAVYNLADALPIMDQHEGYTPDLSDEESRVRNYYQRVTRQVTLRKDGTGYTAIMYVLNTESDYYQQPFIIDHGRVESGDWLEYKSF